MSGSTVSLEPPAVYITSPAGLSALYLPVDYHHHQPGHHQPDFSSPSLNTTPRRKKRPTHTLKRATISDDMSSWTMQRQNQYSPPLPRSAPLERTSPPGMIRIPSININNTPASASVFSAGYNGLGSQCQAPTPPTPASSPSALSSTTHTQPWPAPPSSSSSSSTTHTNQPAKGWTTLHSAAEQFQSLTLHSLLASPDAPINVVSSYSGWTPLHAAVAHGNVAVVASLVANGAEPHLRTRTGQTIVHLAVLSESLKMVEWCVGQTRAADLNDDRDGGDDDADEEEEASERDGKWGLQTRAADGRTPLCLAIDLGYTLVAIKLLELGADPNVIADTNSSNDSEDAKTADNEAIALAASQQPLSNLPTPTAETVTSVSDPHPPTQNTPLHTAVLSDNIPLATALLQAGANPNVLNAALKAPLHIVTSPEMTSLLLEHGARTRFGPVNSSSSSTSTTTTTARTSGTVTGHTTPKGTMQRAWSCPATVPLISDTKEKKTKKQQTVSEAEDVSLLRECLTALITTSSSESSSPTAATTAPSYTRSYSSPTTPYPTSSTPTSSTSSSTSSNTTPSLPLHTHIHAGNKAIIAILLAHSSVMEIAMQDPSTGETAFMAAVRRKRFEVGKMVVQALRDKEKERKGSF